MAPNKDKIERDTRNYVNTDCIILLVLNDAKVCFLLIWKHGKQVCLIEDLIESRSKTKAQGKSSILTSITIATSLSLNGVRRNCVFTKIF